MPTRPARARVAGALVVLLLPLALAACSDGGDGATASEPSVSCPAPKTDTAAGTKIAVQSGGAARTAYVWLPEGYDGTSPVPVVADFHGAGSDALQYTDGFSTMAEEAPRRGYLVVAGDAVPNAVGGVGWQNDTTTASPDVQFTRDMFDTLARDYCIDRDRLYVTGFSSGGGFTAHAACHMPELAAVAPLAGVSLTRPCQDKPPMPMITMHGDADQAVAFAGFPGLTDPASTGSFIGDVSDTVAAWAERNGCAATATSAEIGSAQTQDSATVYTYDDCPDGADVVFYVLHGADHLYPGGLRDSTKLATDPKLSKVDGSGAVLDFFDAHTRQ